MLEHVPQRYSAARRLRRPMPTTAVAKRYFEALSAHDLDAAIACWADGAVDRFVGQQELTAPAGVRAYFAALYDAVPVSGDDVAEQLKRAASTPG
jgi:ketosteroid isomerase-like protein